jgi:type II secretion system protein G
MRRGFTLIELLIVVAIIAILAAIAVPNFLEAQVRSKVSRAHNDMRTIATAVASYAVDNNTIPIDGDDVAVPGSIPYEQKLWYPILTTPIAYLSSVPIDPFNTLLGPVDPSGMTQILFPKDPPFPYAYLTDGSYYQNPYRPDLPINEGKPTTYGITSLGPNRIFDSAMEVGMNRLYDPTNGSVSRGDIIRMGP